MKINVLKGERFEVNPEEISVTFDDVKGVRWSNVFFKFYLYSHTRKMCERKSSRANMPPTGHVVLNQHCLLHLTRVK